MGNSNCVAADYRGDNSPPNMLNYIGLGIGDSFTHPGFCDYCDTTPTDLNCGTNGEFYSNGDGDGKCICRALCTDGCCRKKCTRGSFSGTPDKCCQMGGPDHYMDGNIVRTCKPDFRVNNWINRTCDNSMNAYCKQGDNLFGTACRTWVTTYQPTGQLSKATGNGSVDDVLLTVCNNPTYANRPECGCISAANQARQLLPNSTGVPVQCLMNACANNPSAYRTSNQMQPCDIVNCSINIEDLKVITGNNSPFNMNFAQNCTSTTTGPSSPGTVITPPPHISPSPGPQPGGQPQPGSQPPQSGVQPPQSVVQPLIQPSNEIWIWIGVAIAIVILIIIVVIVLYKLKKKPPK